MITGWRPSAAALSLATTAATALAVAVVWARPELVVFAAPALGALAAAVGTRPPSPAVLTATPDTVRCFEGETATIRVECEPSIQPRPVPGDGLELIGSHGREWTVRAKRWGNHPLVLFIEHRAAGGLLIATETVTVASVRAYPRAPDMDAIPRPADLPERIGTRVGRARGEGVEFDDLRPYVPGDQVRRINWPATARRGKVMLTQRLADRAADVVALIDTYGDAIDASLDAAVRGAVEVVQSALRRGDRAGVVVLGHAPRWLAPDIGARQFYRVVDAVLDARGIAESGLVPPMAVPPAAVVVAFTPLLDARFGVALLDLRRRGHAVVAVDLLREHPSSPDPLAMRLWRLERARMHRDIEMIGIPVVRWPRERLLADALTHLARRPLGVRPR